MSSWATDQHIGPYVLVAPIGSGAMGDVWKASDTRLGRVVAIKRVKEGHHRSFEQEARIIAGLNHPNICQIHDVGPGYLVLEYVDGQPLRGPLAPRQVVQVAVQIARALEAAHRQGVIHRDIKPANIMVTAEGCVKLLDFGIAKMTSLDSTATLEGTIIGTVAYMSPEQAQGVKLDERSDIFSFGSVLYELLCGRRPFEGDSIQQIVQSLLQDRPRPLNTEAALDQLVFRCLEKSPVGRFQTASALKTALEALGSGAAPARPSIAVLPFENMSGDKENEYFSDGLAEEIINSLAQLPGLKVIARTSAFAFKGKNEDIRRIAATLGVEHALEGSVRRAGNRIRVTAQLIAAGDGSHLWSERYDREWADVFAIQDDIAQAIVATLRLKLSPEPGRTRRAAPNLAAYEALLKARHDSLIYSPDAAQRCRKNYEEAIAIDPEYAQAHAELGIQFLTNALPGIVPAHEAMPLARAAAQKALDLDPGLAEAEAVMAAVAGLYDYDWKEAGRRFALAVAHEPVPPYVRFLQGMFYLSPMGLPEVAAAGHGRGLEEDPLSFGGRFQLAVIYLQANRFAEAERDLRQTMALHQSAFQLPMFLALTFAAQDRLPEAVSWAERAYAMGAWHSHPPAILAGLLMRAGQRDRAEQLMSRLKSPDVYGVPTARTFYHLLCGEMDAAAEWSARAIDQRDPRIVLGLQLPLAGQFRSDPRGIEVLRRMNLQDPPAVR